MPPRKPQLPMVVDDEDGDVAFVPRQLLTEIMARVALTGDLASACDARISPGELTEYLRDNDLMNRLEDAKSLYADRLMREILDIADRPISVSFDGDPVLVQASIGMKKDMKARQIDARKFIVSQMRPAKTGVAVNVDARTQTATKNTFIGAAISEKKK